MSLAHDEAGSGEPPVLLVHGWCCDRSYMKPQFDHLSQSHRTVAVDVRGHGESEKPEGDYSMAALAADLLRFIDEKALERPVVIGHSMGGTLALEMAKQAPDRLGAVVLLDSPVLLPDTLKTAIDDFQQGLHSPARVEVARGFVENMLFIPTDDAALKSRVADGMTAAPEHVMVGCWEGLISWDSASAAAACTVPALFVAAEGCPADLERFRKLCPQLEVVSTPGFGHFHQLLAPAEVNRLVDDFLARAS